MILCAGGSYARLAMANEVAGADAAADAAGHRGLCAEISARRTTVIPAPLQDVLRAIRTVRSRAAEFGVRPDRIGVFGASAGGHLAASAAAWFDAAEGRTGAPLDAISAPAGFRRAAVSGRDDDRRRSRMPIRGATCLAHRLRRALIDRLSIESHARADMPPFFIVHTSEDRSVPIENSMALVRRAARAAGVPVESHFYEKGAHGFGVDPDLGATSEWPVSARANGWPAHGFATAQQATRPRPGRRGIEGQRKADLGNGTFLNPIMAGDHPDPSILKDGDDYYMTFSSFDAYPGPGDLALARSRQLAADRSRRCSRMSARCGRRISSSTRAATTSTFPGIAPNRSNYVIWADNIRGPWSAPIDLKLTRIDPGHAVGPDGKRYLFLSAGELVQLADDGLSTMGAPKKIYDGWKYPADWIVETFAQEGPKILRRGDYYYMVLAEGGTAGPPTGHMIVAARSKTIEGPWENSPHNPILRTQSRDERWWSKGHGTLVEDRAGKWWMVYHAYENGFYTLGRQTLLEPIEWTADGWFRMAGADPAAPIAKPAGERGAARLRVLRRFLEAADGRAVELLRRRRRRSRSLSLRERTRWC